MRWACRSTTGAGRPIFAAARSGFAELTRIAHEQCDAWTGLAAAGDTSARVIEAVWRTVDTAGVLQRRARAAPTATSASTTTPGCTCSSAPPTPDDFQLAYAATLCDAGDYAEADKLVDAADRPPAELAARPAGCEWRCTTAPSAGRTSCTLLTPVVNDAEARRDVTPTPRASPSAPRWPGWACSPRRCPTSRSPAGPVEVAAVDGALAKALSLRAQGEDLDAADVLAELYAANPETSRSSRRCRTRPSAS